MKPSIKERDAFFEERYRDFFLNDWILNSKDRNDSIEILEFFYATLFFSDTVIQAYKTQIFENAEGKGFGNPRMELSTIALMKETVENTLGPKRFAYPPGGLLRPFAFPYIAAPEKRRELPNDERFIDAIKKEIAGEKLSAIKEPWMLRSHVFSMLYGLAAVRILFPNDSITMRDDIKEGVRKVIENIKKGAGGDFLDLPELVFLAACATAGRVHVEKGRVRLDPPQKHPKPILPPPTIQNF